jgi:protein-disulfide isomerase
MRHAKTFLLGVFIFFNCVARAETPAVPAMVAGNSTAKNTIEFFLSPTCPHCAATFRNTVLALMDRAANGGDLRVFVAVTPRNPVDVPYARLLSCVPQDKLLGFLTEWYGYRRTGEADLSKLRQIGTRHGLMGTSEAQCTNERNDRMLLAFNRLVFAERQVKDTPAVFLNGKHLPVMLYLWQYEDELATHGVK